MSTAIKVFITVLNDRDKVTFVSPEYLSWLGSPALGTILGKSHSEFVKASLAKYPFMTLDHYGDSDLKKGEPVSAYIMESKVCGTPWVKAYYIPNIVNGDYMGCTVLKTLVRSRIKVSFLELRRNLESKIGKWRK